MRLLQGVSIGLVASVLGTSVIGKVSHGHDSAFTTGPFVYYAMCVVECGLLVAMMTRAYRVSLAFVVLLSTVSIVMQSFTADNRGCGCYGLALGEDPWKPLFLTSLMGIAA